MDPQQVRIKIYWTLVVVYVVDQTLNNVVEEHVLIDVDCMTIHNIEWILDEPHSVYGIDDYMQNTILKRTKIANTVYNFYVYHIVCLCI